MMSTPKISVTLEDLVRLTGRIFTISRSTVHGSFAEPGHRTLSECTQLVAEFFKERRVIVTKGKSDRVSELEARVKELEEQVALWEESWP